MTINTAFFQAITNQANLCRTSAEVARLQARALPALATLQTGIADASAVLAAAQELLTLNPSDLPSVLTFVSKLKSDVIGPLLGPYVEMVAQAAATATAAAGAAAAIEAAASRVAGL